MKSLILKIFIAALLLCSETRTQAQTNQPKLNQFELDKKFIGSWKAEAGKDTTITIKCSLFDNGIETYFKIIAKGKTVVEEKSLLGYDKKTDKLIECSIENGEPNITLYAAWFISETKVVEILLEDISNPENAGFKQVFEFISPDSFVLTNTENNKVTGIYTFHREK